MASIRSLCQTGIMLKKGELHLTGPIENIVNEYVVHSNKILETPLFKKKERTGNGSLRFTDIKIFDRTGAEKIDFEIGESLELKIFFESDTSFSESKYSRIDIDIDDRNKQDSMDEL